MSRQIHVTKDTTKLINDFFDLEQKAILIEYTAGIITKSTAAYEVIVINTERNEMLENLRKNNR